MLSVLVVDDSLIIRRNLKKILEEIGHNVVSEAKDGKEAFVQYKRHLPDLVTMDITMPEMDGISAVKKIISEFPEAKIVMITSHGQENMVISAVQSGAKGYILKPLKKDKIIDVIENVFKIDHKEMEAIKAEEEEKRKIVKDKLENFYIENLSGLFILKIRTRHKSITQGIIMEIADYVENLFIIKPLNIIFDFSQIVFMDDEAIIAMFKLMNRINEFDVIAKIYAPYDDLRDAIKLSHKNNKVTIFKLLSKLPD